MLTNDLNNTLARHVSSLPRSGNNAQAIDVRNLGPAPFNSSIVLLPQLGAPLIISKPGGQTFIKHGSNVAVIPPNK